MNNLYSHRSFPRIAPIRSNRTFTSVKVSLRDSFTTTQPKLNHLIIQNKHNLNGTLLSSNINSSLQKLQTSSTIISKRFMSIQDDDGRRTLRSRFEDIKEKPNSSRWSYRLHNNILWKYRRGILWSGISAGLIWFFGRKLFYTLLVVVGIVGIWRVFWKYYRKRLFLPFFNESLDLIKQHRVRIEKEIGGTVPLPKFDNVIFLKGRSPSTTGKLVDAIKYDFRIGGKNGVGFCEVWATQQRESDGKSVFAVRDIESLADPLNPSGWVTRDISLQYVTYENKSAIPKKIEIYVDPYNDLALDSNAEKSRSIVDDEEEEFTVEEDEDIDIDTTDIELDRTTKLGGGRKTAFPKPKSNVIYAEGTADEYTQKKEKNK